MHARLRFRLYVLPTPPQVSGNHRLDDNEAEQQRILAQGGELAPVHYEDEGYVGALRVWPGGLAMSRTIGDVRAGDLVTAVPEVKRVRDGDAYIVHGVWLCCDGVLMVC